MANWKVYKIIEKGTGNTVYIGVTKRTLNTRFTAHKRERDFLTKDKYSIQLLHENLPTSTAAGVLEKLYIKILGTYKPEIGFNLTKGGVGSQIEWTEASRNKVAERVKGNKHALGMRHTAEARLQMSVSRKGKATTTGYKHSEQTKLKLSEALKGKIRSATTKEKMSQANKKRNENRGLPDGVSFDNRVGGYYVRARINSVCVNFGQYGQDLDRAAEAAKIAQEFHRNGTPLSDIKHAVFTAKRFAVK
jgi:hypothetical protein